MSYGLLTSRQSKSEDLGGRFLPLGEGEGEGVPEPGQLLRSFGPRNTVTSQPQTEEMSTPIGELLMSSGMLSTV